MTKLTVLLAASLCLAVAGAAQADLIAFTGNTYNWVSYNDLTAGSPAVGSMDLTPGLKYLTDWSVDTDHATDLLFTHIWTQGVSAGVGVTSGDLRNYETGAVTASMAISLVNPQVNNNLWTSGGGRPSSGARATVFGDTLGVASGTGYGSKVQEQHNPIFVAGRGTSFIFSGLDNAATYDFAAEASSTTTSYGHMEYVVAVGAGATNDSIASSGFTPGQISGLGDDLIVFTGISPVGGIIEIQVLSLGDPSNSKDLSMGSFALGEVAPEPATLGLLCLGAGLALLRRRRWHGRRTGT